MRIIEWMAIAMDVPLYFPRPRGVARDGGEGQSLPSARHPVQPEVEDVNRHAKLTPYRRPKLPPLSCVEIRA